MMSCNFLIKIYSYIVFILPFYMVLFSIDAVGASSVYENRLAEQFACRTTGQAGPNNHSLNVISLSVMQHHTSLVGLEQGKLLATVMLPKLTFDCMFYRENNAASNHQSWRWYVDHHISAAQYPNQNDDRLCATSVEGIGVKYIKSSYPTTGSNQRDGYIPCGVWGPVAIVPRILTIGRNNDFTYTMDSEEPFAELYLVEPNKVVGSQGLVTIPSNNFATLNANIYYTPYDSRRWWGRGDLLSPIRFNWYPTYCLTNTTHSVDFGGIGTNKSIDRSFDFVTVDSRCTSDFENYLERVNVSFNGVVTGTNFRLRNCSDSDCATGATISLFDGNNNPIELNKTVSLNNYMSQGSSTARVRAKLETGNTPGLINSMLNVTFTYN